MNAECNMEKKQKRSGLPELHLNRYGSTNKAGHEIKHIRIVRYRNTNIAPGSEPKTTTSYTIIQHNMHRYDTSIHTRRRKNKSSLL